MPELPSVSDRLAAANMATTSLLGESILRVGREQGRTDQQMADLIGLAVDELAGAERADLTLSDVQELALAANAELEISVQQWRECRDCRACSDSTTLMRRMYVCPLCGSKRCPRAADHRNGCTDPDGLIGATDA